MIKLHRYLRKEETMKKSSVLISILVLSAVIFCLSGCGAENEYIGEWKPVSAKKLDGVFPGAGAIYTEIEGSDFNEKYGDDYVKFSNGGKCDVIYEGKHMNGTWEIVERGAYWTGEVLLFKYAGYEDKYTADGTREPQFTEMDFYFPDEDNKDTLQLSQRNNIVVIYERQ